MMILKDLFLIYSHADKPFVHKLANDCEQHGISVWLDEAELLIGDSLIKKIEQGIDRTRFLGAVVSANSVDSEWVKKELEQAFKSEILSGSAKVLPIVLGCVDRLPGFLRNKLYADFSGWPKDRSQYETSFRLLIRSISKRKTEDVKSILKKREGNVSCFISHSKQDSGFIKVLAKRLKDEDILYRLDIKDIKNNMLGEIDNAINNQRKFILCCSKNSLSSWWVNVELEKAIQKEKKLWDKQRERGAFILPIDLDGYMHHWTDYKFSILKKRLIIDFKNWKDPNKFENSFQKLLSCLISKGN